MADLKLYTPSLKDDTVTYPYALDFTSTLNATIVQVYDEILTANQLMFSCKLVGNNAGMQISVLQDKSGIEIKTSDGVSEYTDTFVISFSNDGIYNNAFIWSGTPGDNALFSNGSIFQSIDTTNWLTWTGDSSADIAIGGSSETQTLKSSITSENGSDNDTYLYNEGTSVYNDTQTVSATLTTGNWQDVLEYEYQNVLRSCDVWQNDSTDEYILFYYRDGNVPAMPSGSSLAGYTWIATITAPQYISKYNGFKVVDPRDGVTLLGYDEITDPAEDGYIFYKLEDDLIKGLIIYDTKLDGECYNKAIKALNIELLTFNGDIVTQDGLYITTQKL